MSTVVPRRFTIDEYHRMADTGVLRPDERVELIEGEIVEMSPIGSRHAAQVDRLLNLLVPLLAGRAIVRAQNPMRLSDLSEPQPDLCLAWHRDDFYATAHPAPSAVLLAIEVADSSVDYDRQVKVPLYARSGIPETWLLDLVRLRVEVYRQPGLEGYGQRVVLEAGEALVVEALPDVSIDVDWLVP